MLRHHEIRKIKDLSGHNAAIYSMVYDPRHKDLYTAGGDGWIARWKPLGDKDDGILIGNTSSKIFSISLDQTSGLLVAGDMDGDLYWIDTVEQKIIKRYTFHKGSIFDLVFAENDYLYSAGADGYLCRWSKSEMQPEMSHKISSQGLRCLKYHQGYELLYVGASDNRIYAVDAMTLQIHHVIHQAHTNSVFSLELTDEHTLVSGGRDALCHVWDLDTYQKKSTIAAHWFTVNKIVNMPEIDTFATSSRDKTWRIWDANNFNLLKSIDVHKGGHFNSVNALIWIPEGQMIVSAGDDRVVRTWILEESDIKMD